MKKLMCILFALSAMISLYGQNYCLDFDGVDEYVEVPYSSDLNPSTFTVSCWVKIEGGDGTYRSPLSSRSVPEAGIWKGYMIYANPSDQWDFVIGNGTGGVGLNATDVDVINGEWTHLAGTYDGTNLKFYINGVLGSEIETAFVANNANPFRIAAGKNETLPDYFMDGQIDEVCIWNIARTEQEINEDMYIELEGTESGLVAYYKLNEQSGSIAGDSVGSNDGTLINMEEEDWVDLSLPIVLIFLPADNSLNIDLETDLVINFDKGVQAGSGNITIHKTSDDSVFEIFPVSSCVILDSTVTIDPVNNLEWDTEYYVTIDSTAFMDSDSLYFEGITDKEEWNFRSQDWISTLYPKDNSFNADLETDLIITFNAVMQAGSGNITIYKTSDDSVFETIPAVSTTIIDSTVTIDHVNDFELQTDYYVLIDSTAFMDPDSVYFTGITDKEEWNLRSLNFFTNNTFLPEPDGRADWGDYDNDGDLDILWSGIIGGEKISNIYRNDAGVFTDINAGLCNVYGSSLGWVDYDNDGDLDIFLTGYDGPSSFDVVFKIYRNDAGVFTDINTELTPVIRSSVSWGDYDNDGDLDILLTGWFYDGTFHYISKIYRNDSGVFTDINAGLTGVCNSSVAWVDYDNDGDLDILLTGYDANYTRISKIYRNDSGNFTDINAGLTGVENSSVAWGDYDDDGDLDILLTGQYQGYPSYPCVSKIYRNDSGVFTDINAGLTGVDNGSVSWGDYDNDGDLDILLTGSTGSECISKIYRNDSGVFTDINAGLTGVYFSSVAWGDYDNDGDLDILLTGSYYDNGTNYISKIYRNNSLIFNTVPNCPSNLSTDLNGSEVRFSWDRATDDETPQNGLSYNIEVVVDSTTVTSSMSDITTGYRKIVAIGNTSLNSCHILNLTDSLFPQEDRVKNISLKVQAIDHSFAGSEFACMDTTFLSRDLEIITLNEMESTDLLTWEYVIPDSLSNYQLQIDEDINFESPFEEIILLSKKESKDTYYMFALNELGDFDSLVNNTRYYWRVKPNYIYRTSRFPAEPASFIFNPTYSAPSPVNIEITGEFITLTWNDVKDAEKGEVYNVYSTDDPYAEFPDGWKYEANVNGTQWLTTASALKKFYCVTATGGLKTEGKVEVKDSESSLK